jgi:hypothetical protein
VSGVGDDLAACSRTAPCKTFAAAFAATAAGGEINCLDSAGYGTLTINKSITILCEGVTAGILASVRHLKDSEAERNALRESLARVTAALDAMREKRSEVP